MAVYNLRGACASLVLLMAVVCLAQTAAAKRPTLLAAVEQMPELSEVVEKLKEVGLDKQFAKPGLKITAFIPSNDAFNKITKAIGDNPAIMGNQKIIKTALAYHILNGAKEVSDFPLGISSAPTVLGGTPLRITRTEDGKLKVGPYNVVEANIEAGKSVIHVIDGFMVPPTLIPTLVSATRAAKGNLTAAAALLKP